MNTKVDSAIKTIAVAAMFSAALFCSSPAAGITLVGTFNGTTNYVSKSGSDSNGGTGWDYAKLTIQAAVDLCADGDTVIVDDGEYSDTTSWTSSYDNTYSIPTVVQITNRIHLVSRNGKFKTHIVGQWANTSSGVANDGTAHRCIFVGKYVANVLIEGFTIRDGSVAAETAGNKDYDCGAGVYGNEGGSGHTYVLDCDILNCRAGAGAAAARRVVPVRCTFVGNRGAQNQHVFYRTDFAYNCVFAFNGGASRSGAVFSDVQNVKAANCTFINNNCYGFRPNDKPLHVAYNCAFLGASESGGTVSSAYFTNCVQTATSGRIATQGSAAGDTAGVSEYQHFYAADSDEWKFLSGGNLKDAGLDAARAVAATFVPVEYLDTDFFGNPRKVGGHVDIGAIEAQGDSVAAPASGYISLSTNVAVRAGEKFISMPGGLVAIESDMVQARLLPAIGPETPFFGFVLSGAWGSFCRYPDRGNDRGAWMTPPALGETVTVNVKTATEEKWVNASYEGGDSDGSTAKPYTTIQDAVYNTAAYGLVHVAEGTYDTGGVKLTDHSVISRVGIDNHIAIRASGDPAATIIKGGENTRCVAVRRQAVEAHVQGFTLQNGIADYGTTDANGLGGGFYTTPQTWGDTTGLVLTYQRNSQVTDCIFTNNAAKQGSAICGGWAQRCVFVGNAVTATDRGSGNETRRGAVAFKSILSACRVKKNPQKEACTNAICSLYKCHPYNVTFSETNRFVDSSSSYRPVDRNTPAYNCAFLGGFLDTHNESVTIVPAGNVGDDSLANHSWLALYARRDLYADPDGDDLHLRAGTDASTKGDASAYRAAMFAVGDFEGNALAYVNGNPIPGAYSTLAGCDIYVNAVSGNDANDGFAADSAKKTIGAALALAYAGDVVHAAPGDYNEGSTTYTGGTIIADPKDGRPSPSRGVVNRGVTLVSDEGPEVTFISGVVGDGSNGLGDNAVRCLTALGGSSVRGFTLRNGGTFNTTGAVRDENIGGLALTLSCRHGETGTAVLENCVLSNGWGRTAGCVAGGILRHCKVFDGHATSGATLSMYSRFENCLLVTGSSGNTGVRYCGGMLSTTFINKNFGGDGNNAEFNDSLYGYGASYENSILATANRSSAVAVTLKNVTNCLWVTGGNIATIDDGTSANVITAATVAVALAMLDGDYRPLAGTSLIDAGDRALLAHLAGDATTDLGGGQRIYGGQVDIGAYEYDLRPAMSAALHRMVSVASAPPDATLSGGNVTLPSGEMAVTLTASEDRAFFVPVEVTGTGTLSVFVGDSGTAVATVSAADGATSPRISVPAGATMRFVYAGDTGAATIGSFVSDIGMTIIVF